MTAKVLVPASAGYPLPCWWHTSVSGSLCWCKSARNSNSSSVLQIVLERAWNQWLNETTPTISCLFWGLSSLLASGSVTNSASASASPQFPPSSNGLLSGDITASASTQHRDSSLSHNPHSSEDSLTRFKAAPTQPFHRSCWDTALRRSSSLHQWREGLRALLQI